MSRWGRGRSGSVAVPLDSTLFRENTNCPSAARSAGTVGKWGITSFTSIRSAPYAFANNVVKKPVQDQNSPLTVPAIETDQPPPKPKKFFKSRNTEAFPPVPQITYAPPVLPAGLSPEHPSSSKEKKTTKRRAHNRGDSSSPELPRRSEKTKSRKNSVATKAAKKEDAFSESSQPPNKRYLVRTRNKVINYAEDGSNSPIPDFSDRFEELPTPTKVSTPPRDPTPPPVAIPEVSPSVSSPSKTDVASPSTSKDSSDERKPPPIVLRISKGTSRIVSTDSNEGFTSPSSDRHSSLDVHDFSQDVKKSPTLETICSPKHEGLKITIKCGGLKQETEVKENKKEKKKHKKHHKHNDDHLKKALSPVPGTENYDLYKTLASPTQEKPVKESEDDEIESQLAKLDSTGQSTKSPRLNSQNTEPLPEPKPPESTKGRSRRNRPNINYNENDDFFDTITSSSYPAKQAIKTVSDLKRETRKGRKKAETANDTPQVTSPDHTKVEETNESHVDQSDLIDILSGTNEKKDTETHKKPHKKQKHRHYSKHSSPDHPEVVPNNPSEEKLVEEPETIAEAPEEIPVETDQPVSNDDPQTTESSQPSDTVYNGATENSEEEYYGKTSDAFKFPNDVGSSEEQTDDKPSVKLVITKKKGSIFKSKSLVNDESPLPARKRRHLYRHEWANDKGNETPRPEQPEETAATAPVGEVPQALTTVTRYRAPDPIHDDLTSTETVKPYTSVKCAREAKEYYTVVRNVKKAHQIQEIGEFQEFNDDVEYLLDALQDNNPISTRCLSAITLASKCTAPAFRMHLRAHGTVQKFFSALHDATVDQSLGLCTATVMFVLSQDRLNMDLDRESLELMLNLLESDASHKNALDDCGLTSAQLTKTQERVRELCAEIKSQGKAKHLDLDNITVGHLAMETLLSLTSKRAGEWFKEELRNLGGVEHIVRTIKDCAAQLHTPSDAWGSGHVDILRKADRCMRVLENVTQQNEDNQMYLLSSVNGASNTVASLLIRCATEAKVNKDIREALLDAALPALKVLVNLSHSFGDAVSLGAKIVGELPGVMEICLMLLNNQGNFIPDSKSFEFNICLLLLLINLVQNNEVNSQRLLDIRVRIDNEDDVISRSVPALDLIIDLFYKREELARRAEENTDALLDGKKDDESDSDNKKQSQDDIDETVAKLLARAGAHMEHTMVGAYMALLVGHAGVASGTYLPNYSPLLPTLRKYYTFLSLTASAEAAIVAHVKATHKIIQFMENHDKQESPEAQGPSHTQSATQLHTPHLQHTLMQSPAPYAMNVYPGYYQTSPSDVPQDMSLSNLNCGLNYSSSSSDRMSNSIDGYH